MSKHLVKSALIALTTLATLTTMIGCGIGQLSTATEPLSGTLVVQGLVHGGQQAVTGATIQLWAVGSTGYGSAASKLLGSHVVTTDSNGSFSITGDYTCPTSGNGLVYITSTGGNPGLAPGTNNSAIVMASALGSCATLLANAATTYVYIDEVTTAATAIALAQYFTPTFGATSTDSFGAPNTTQAQVGITNAFATVNNLVNTTTGNAITTNTLTNAGFTITVTPESAKLYTIADILAACVNSDGTSTSPCQTILFPDVTPTGGVQPTDTLQAAVDMALNPTSSGGSGYAANMAALYGLQGGTPPYTGAASQPTDWTIGINYADSTAGAPVLTQPADLAVDASGNIWVVNDASAGTSNGALGELGPTGTPLLGTTFPNETGATTLAAAGPRTAAIDLGGNVWIASTAGSGYTYEYSPGISSPTGEIPYAHLSKAPWGLAVDQNGNTYTAMESSTVTATEIYEFPAGVGATSSVINQEGEFAVGIFGGEGAIRPEYMAFDNSSSHNLWMTSGSALTSVGQLSDITLCTPSGGPPAVCTESTTSGANTYTSENSSVGTTSVPSGLAAGPNGMWFANRGGNTITYLPLAANGTYTASTQAIYGSVATLGAPTYLVVDGNANVWTTDNAQTSPGSIEELNGLGSVVSPSSAGTTPFNVLGYSHVGIGTGAGIAVDPSGNVWVANNTTGTSSASVFELVGAAAPTITPIAASLVGSKVGTKP